MSRSKGRRRLGHGRPPARRDKTPRYLVAVGGEVTEADYFKLRNKLLGNKASLTVRDQRADPLGLARYAARLKEAEDARGGDGDGFAGVFVVTDVDDFSLDSFKEAQRACRDAGIGLVISNPCFEVWLIDHEEVCQSRTTPDAKARAKRLGVVGGDSGKVINNSMIEGRLSTAIGNARRHNSDERAVARAGLHTLDFGPWTDMPDVEEVLEGGISHSPQGSS